MAEVKQLILEGKYVGDVESTGDTIKDAEACIDLLKEKGLYRQRRLSRRSFGKQSPSQLRPHIYINAILLLYPETG